jgi:hypothetical protein
MTTLLSAYVFNELGVYDYSGNKNHLTNSGGTFPADSSPWGLGNDFDFTSGNKASSLTYQSFAGLTSFSFFTYFKWNSGHGFLLNTGNPCLSIAASGQMTFSITSSGMTGFSLNSTTNLVTGIWYFVACTWDGLSLRIFINGVQDSIIDAHFSTLYAGDNSFYLSTGGTLACTVKLVEARNIALSATQQGYLMASPGGVLYTVDVHNFAIGDLFADPTVVNQGVVTYVVDQSNFYAYPLNGDQPQSIAKYGNIYNTLRQAIMEMNNDFDGNGNSQISIKKGIASFNDYNLPPSIITLDYNGLSGSPDSIQNMMAITSLRV